MFNYRSGREGGRRLEDRSYQNGMGFFKWISSEKSEAKFETLREASRYIENGRIAFNNLKIRFTLPRLTRYPAIIFPPLNQLGRRMWKRGVPYFEVFSLSRGERAHRGRLPPLKDKKGVNK